MLKKIVITIGIVFLVGMAGFTLWSRTLYQESLPKVRLALTHKGSFVFKYTKYGTLRKNDASDVEFAYNITLNFSAEEHKGTFPWWRDDVLPLTFPAYRDGEAEGVIRDVIVTEEGIEVIIGVSHPSVREGDSVSIEMYKDTPELEHIIPLSAVMYEDGLAYVFIVEKAAGPWGRQYVVKKENVIPGLSDGENIMLWTAPNAPIVVASSEPLWAGRIVRFYP